MDYFNKCSNCKLNLQSCSKRRSEKHLSVTLNITDKCNDKCDFCWHKDNKYKEKDMGKEDIDNMLDILLKQFPDYDISFIFMGGEPTLNLSIIEYSMQELLKRKNKNHGTIVTNGTGSINEIIKLIELCQNLKIIISLPNNYVYRNTLNNIEEYIQLQNRFNILFSLVITETDVKKGIFNDILYWKNKGINNLTLIHEFNMNSIKMENNYTKTLFNELINLSSLIDNRFKITNFYPLLEKQFINLNLIKIAYFSNGEFYMNSKSKFFQNSSIGNVKDGININKYIKNLKLLPCYQCKFKNICNYDPGLFFKNDQIILNNNFCNYMQTFLKVKEIYNNV